MYGYNILTTVLDKGVINY